MTLYFGIDPGPEQSGWVIYEHFVVDQECGRVTDTGVWDNESVLARLEGASHKLRCLVLEEPVHYRTAIAGRDVLQSMRWCGRFEGAADVGGVKTVYIPRPDVCQVLLGHRSLKKSVVNDELRRRHPGGKGTKKESGPLFGITSHAWDALAAIVAHIETEGVGPI